MNARIIIVVVATMIIATADCPVNHGDFLVEWDTVTANPPVTGSELDRFNVVFLAEGFQGGYLYYAYIYDRVDEAIEAIFAMEPYKDYRCAFNFYQVELESKDVGADHPWRSEEPKCVDTALNMTFGSVEKDYDERMLVTPTPSRLIDAAFLATQNVDLILVLVNDDSAGGVAYETGGIPWASVSVGKAFHEVLTHELAHALTRSVETQDVLYLQDEYSCGCCVTAECPPGYNSMPSCGCCPEDFCGAGSHEQVVYTGPQEGEWVPEQCANVTTETNYDDIKWRDLINVPATAFPTTDADIVGVAESAVGLFEGAVEYQRMIYRPQRECHMRALNDTLTGEIEPFCAVCTRTLEAVLEAHCVPESGTTLIPLLFKSNYIYAETRGKWYIPPCVGCLYGQRNKIRIDVEGLPPQVIGAVEEMNGKEVGRGTRGPKGVLSVEFSANMGDEYFLTLTTKGGEFELLEFSARVWINGEETRLPN